MPYVTLLQFVKALILLLFTFCQVTLHAQQNKQIPILTSRDTLLYPSFDSSMQENRVPEKDLPEVIGSLFSKKRVRAKTPALITNKPVYSIVPAIGYTLQTRLAAVLSGNVVYHTDSTAKLSAISANATYTQNKQFYFHVQPKIWTKRNGYNLTGDIGFYKYPQSTFGMGSGSLVENEDPMDYYYLRFNPVVLKQIAGNFFGGIGYMLEHRWNISEKGTRSGAISEYKKYGAPTTTTSSGVTLNASFDTRDNSINPSKGLYGNLQLRNNFTAFGSTCNWKSLIIEVRKFFKLPRKSSNVLAFWSYNWLVLSGKPPYLDLPSNGWDTYSATGRGYIQGRFRGAQMVYFETEYRFKISANGLFGGALYANAQSFSAMPGSKLQCVQPGFGPGLRVKLNKKSKTNICLDYAFGSQGSRGLFITVGELF